MLCWLGQAEQRPGLLWENISLHTQSAGEKHRRPGGCFVRIVRTETHTSTVSVVIPLQVFGMCSRNVRTTIYTQHIALRGIIKIVRIAARIPKTTGGHPQPGPWVLCGERSLCGTHRRAKPR